MSTKRVQHREPREPKKERLRADEIRAENQRLRRENARLRRELEKRTSAVVDDEDVVATISISKIETIEPTCQNCGGRLKTTGLLAGSRWRYCEKCKWRQKINS